MLKSRTFFLLLSLTMTFAVDAFSYATKPPSSSVISPRKVLMIGDSLSVGPFGDSLQDFLISTFSDAQVGFIAACGSSPEHWLQSEPQFVSKCGYRLKNPKDSSKSQVGRFEDGRPPRPYPVPKLETTLNYWKADLVIVQLGTNWFDVLAESQSEHVMANLDGILDHFAQVIAKCPSHPKLIWVTPPDCYKFRKVQSLVTAAIKRAASRNQFRVIDSSKMIQYEPGKSGGDGVHLATASADEWAEKVKKQLRSMISISASANSRGIATGTFADHSE
jgi:hypothetical protein